MRYDPCFGHQWQSFANPFQELGFHLRNLQHCWFRFCGHGVADITILFYFSRSHAIGSPSIPSLVLAQDLIWPKNEGWSILGTILLLTAEVFGKMVLNLISTSALNIQVFPVYFFRWGQTILGPLLYRLWISYVVALLHCGLCTLTLLTSASYLGWTNWFSKPLRSQESTRSLPPSSVCLCTSHCKKAFHLPFSASSFSHRQISYLLKVFLLLTFFA